MSDGLKKIFFQSINRFWLILQFLIEVETIGSPTFAALGGQSILLWLWVVVDDLGDDLRVLLFVEVLDGAAEHFF